MGDARRCGLRIATSATRERSCPRVRLLFSDCAFRCCCQLYRRHAAVRRIDAPDDLAFDGRLMARAAFAEMFAPMPIPKRFSDRFPVSLSFRSTQLRASSEEASMMVPAARRLSSQYGAILSPVTIMAGDAVKIADFERQSKALHDAVPGSSFEAVSRRWAIWRIMRRPPRSQSRSMKSHLKGSLRRRLELSACQQSQQIFGRTRALFSRSLRIDWRALTVTTGDELGGQRGLVHPHRHDDACVIPVHFNRPAKSGHASRQKLAAKTADFLTKGPPRSVQTATRLARTGARPMSATSASPN